MRTLAIAICASGLFACTSSAPDEPTGTDTAGLLGEDQCADSWCEPPPPPPPPAPENPPCLCGIAAYAKAYANGGLGAFAQGEPADAYATWALSLTISGSGYDDQYRRAICSQLCQNEARSTSANTVCVQLGYEAGLVLQYNTRLPYDRFRDYKELWGDCHNP